MMYPMGANSNMSFKGDLMLMIWLYSNQKKKRNMLLTISQKIQIP